MSHDQLAGERLVSCLRQRPFISADRSRDQRRDAIRVNQATGGVECHNASDPHAKVHSFNFDHVFDKTSTNEDVYGKIAPVIAAAFRGGKSTVVSCGASASGKTHTHDGIMHLAFSKIFPMLERNKHKFRYSLRASFVELYQSDVHDLFGRAGSELPKKKIRKDASSGLFYVQDLTEYELTSFADFQRIRKQSSKKRRSAHASMGVATSRSHTIFRVAVNLYRSDIPAPSPGREERPTSSGTSKHTLRLSHAHSFIWNI
jgi:hypothetical protein